MNIRPMLGEFALEGIESVASYERRALVEHRVPGLAGSYFQDLGTMPNIVVIAGSRFGDDARAAFLEGIRKLYNKGEQTTFVADINTATDLTDVVIEALDVAEVTGSDAGFRYVLRLRKYIPPPEPPAASLAGLDTSILDDAANLAGALDALDALGSIPNLGDPTPPLRTALADVTAATASLPTVQESISTLLGGSGGSPLDALPDGNALQSTLAAVVGSRDEGSGVAGAAEALASAGTSIQPTTLVNQLDAAFAAVQPGGSGSAAPGANALADLQAAVGALPTNPATLTAPLSGRLEAIGNLLGESALGALSSAIQGLEALPAQAGSDATALLAGAGFSSLDALLHEGPLGNVSRFSEALSLLADTLAGTDKADGAGAPGTPNAPDALRGRLLDLLTERAQTLATDLFGQSEPPARALATALDGALSTSRAATLQSAAEALRAAFEALRSDWASGASSSGDRMAAATAAHGALVQVLEESATALEGALRLPGASSSTLAAWLGELYDRLEAMEIVDFANLGDQIARALAPLQTAIAALDLGRVRALLEGGTAQLTELLSGLNVNSITASLDAATAPLRSAADGLQAALFDTVGVVRSALDDLLTALRSLTAALGETGADGRFRFHLQGEIEEFLAGVRGALEGVLRPALEQFRTLITTTTAAVTDALSQARDAIDGVKAQLQQALQAAVETLRALDLPARLAAVRTQLETMVGALNNITFDLIVNPVVAQIEEMRDRLRQIDLSRLNDLLRAALRTAVQVVTQINFVEMIREPLLGEFDKLLEAPVGAIDDVGARADAGLARINVLSPTIVLQPLRELFTPVAQALDGLQLGTLTAPLTAWHTRASAQLESFMPAALLQPLLESYSELVRLLASVSASSLAGLLDTQIAALRSELERVDPARLAQSLATVTGQAIAWVEGLAPATQLAPLTAEYARLDSALAAMRPSALIAPAGRLFDLLSAPLAALTDEDAQQVAAAFAPLIAAPAFVDATAQARDASAAISAARTRLESLGAGHAIALVKPAYDAALAAMPAGDAAAAQLAALNPLQAADLARLSSRFQTMAQQMQNAYTTSLPADLAARAAGVQTITQGLAPAWARGTPTAEALRSAAAALNPTALASSLDAAFTTALAPWRALDPAALATALDTGHQQLLASLRALDPAALVASLGSLVPDLLTALNAISPQSLAQEGAALEEQIRALAAALDPTPIITALNDLTNEVRTIFAGLEPGALLAGLQEPLDATRALASAFDPASFAALLQPITDEIEATLNTIAVGPLLEPITARLHALRDDLEDALQRTETAFDAMLAAIPL